MTINELNNICNEHPVPCGALYDRLWYYSEKDDIGVKICVAFRFWQHSRHVEHGHTPEDGWDAECHFSKGDKYFYVVTGCRDKTPQETIQFFLDVWNRLECDYAKKWE